ncbi:PIR Superfamily Protein [Plasmodium ovale wallikeri]|uniref:PIR Superfamily Protein n=1 Tax=Plasmodium ovale wallikeri TaxID=864142 RepID=A0A1A9ARI3_PLAOA|nr:PIR Superfamily Protein [Plasmodium ovale wallikeri]
MEDNINVLEQIDSLYFDYKLENINGKCTNCATCSKYGQGLTNLFSFQLLCQRLVKNIEYIHSANAINSKYLDEKSCDDFIYWIHNNVYNMNDKKNHNENINIFGHLKNIWDEVNRNLKGSGIDPLYKCNISNIETLKLDELKEKKIMSDYCQNFDNLTIKLTTNPHKPHCHIYYDYFMKTMKAYEKISELCHNSSNSKCPNICLQKNVDPKRILNSLKCAKIQAQEKKENLIPEEKCNTEKDALNSQLQQALSAADNPAFNYSDPRSVFLILFTFWGMLLTFFFLYKYFRNNFCGGIPNNYQRFECNYNI